MRSPPPILALVLLLPAAACRQEQAVLPLVDAPASPLRAVRVLVGARLERVHLRTEGSLDIESDKGLSLGSVPADAGVFVVAEPGAGLRFDDTIVSAAEVTVRASTARPIALSAARDGPETLARRYPGVLQITATPDGRLDVVNFVDVEPYVGCVVANEVWPSFHDESYRAQAVASRSFVVYQMERRRDAAFDVSATQGSQVYRGLRNDTAGKRAAEAAHYTRGLVCTYRDGGLDRLFCAYYSAACGGMSQSASIFGKENEVPPLAGGIRCDYCKIAPGETYRWGPVRLTKDDLTARLAASSLDLAALGVIQAVGITERTDAGRAVRIRLTGSSGDSRDLLAERFRLAVGGNLIRSTDFKLRDTERELIFEDGRGFGHGLGLCQWGMEGLAKTGKSAAEILGFYYPGSTLTRLY